MDPPQLARTDYAELVTSSKTTNTWRLFVIVGLSQTVAYIFVRLRWRERSLVALVSLPHSHKGDTNEPRISVLGLSLSPRYLLICLVTALGRLFDKAQLALIIPRLFVFQPRRGRMSLPISCVVSHTQPSSSRYICTTFAPRLFKLLLTGLR